jgi:hypothetical protein
MDANNIVQSLIFELTKLNIENRYAAIMAWRGHFVDLTENDSDQKNQNVDIVYW